MIPQNTRTWYILNSYVRQIYRLDPGLPLGDVVEDLICIAQVQPRKPVRDLSDFTAPMRQHELDHTDQESLCSERPRPWTVEIDDPSVRAVHTFNLADNVLIQVVVCMICTFKYFDIDIITSILHKSDRSDQADQIDKIDQISDRSDT